MLCDVHCHFFSQSFFRALAEQRDGANSDEAALAVTKLLGWDDPGSPEELAKRWTEELDQASVQRAALIASIPGDEDSVAEAVRLYPDRFVGFFMLDASRPDVSRRIDRALGDLSLRCVCLFPAMHHYFLYDEAVERVFETVASHPGCAVFAHCGSLSLGVRKKLGLPTVFPARFSNPLDLQEVVQRFPELPVIIPHFGAGLFREALMLADACPNVYLDTSSSNGWVRYHPGLTLEGVFERALDVVGADRLIFGSDSSFFPRGWNGAIYAEQAQVLQSLGVEAEVAEPLFSDNFNRLFPA